MKESTETVFDNGPLVQTLMNAIAPVSPNGDAGYPVTFPGDNSQNQTYYYFSTPLMLSRGGTFSCGNVPWRTAEAINLVFAPGVDGIIWDSGYNSQDGGWSDADVDGCGIRSLGFGYANTTNASNQITNANYQKSYGPLNGPGYAVGDGLIVKDLVGTGLPLAVPPGTTVTAVDGTTLTLSNSVNATISSAITYQLPVGLAYSVSTTTGSNSVAVTSGPAWKIQSGDMIWADGFTFGCMVWSATGSAGAQTLLIVDARANGTACNSTATHASGTGKLWIVPAALKRNNGSHSHNNYVYGWPIGLYMPCASGMTMPINCTESFDEGNSYESNLVGRWTAGNNTGASTSIGESFGRDYRYDILEGGSIGSTYIGVTANSYESNNSPSAIVGGCNSQNYSSFLGTYESDTQLAGFEQWYCLTPTDLYGGPFSQAPYPYGASVAFYGSIYGGPPDVSAVGNGTFNGPWQFWGAKIANPNPGQNTCMTLAGGDPSKNGGANLGFAFNCEQQTRFRLSYSYSWDAWQWQFFNNNSYEFLAGPTYAGYMGDTAGYYNYVYYPNGIMLSGEPSPFGAERLFDSRASTPTGAWQKQGDVSLNRSAVAGGTAGWIDTAAGANFRPFGPIANDAAGMQWSLPVVIMGSSTFALLPPCKAQLKGARQFITDGPNSPVFTQVATGGGKKFSPVYCDGTSWRNG